MNRCPTAALLVLTGVIAFVGACGTPTAMDVAEAYVTATNAQDAAGLFADNAVKIDVNAHEYRGKEAIREQLAQAFGQIEYGEMVEAPHVVGDHITWVRINYDRLARQAVPVRQSMWVTQGKIVRFVGVLSEPAQPTVTPTG